jgi:hypothetical protein
MRVVAERGDFRVKAIAGTHTILIAIDGPEPRRQGLLGFAFRREAVGRRARGYKWLRSLKVFKSVIPEPQKERDPRDPSKPRRFSTWEFPIQSFLWGDYTAEPGVRYKFAVVPMYGRPGALKPARGVTFEIRTEKAVDQGHGVWFNRAAIASQAFAREFGNKAPADENNPKDPETAWLSRGLLEACLRFIDKTPAGDGLRVAAYEFTYPPVLNALKAAVDRGVTVRIIYHDTTHGAGKENGANETAIAEAGLTARMQRKRVLYPRTKTKIPHNKFILRLAGDAEPVAVWTGSTNFTSSGFLGQANVGHVVEEPDTARQYLAYWKLLKRDPERAVARKGAMKLTPNPPPLISADSVAQVFSPRTRSELLGWYGDRIADAQETVMFTAAFGVTKALVGPLAKDRDILRFILMEKPPTQKVKLELTKDRDLIISWGASLGKMYTFKNGKPAARKNIKDFELDKWLLKEDHYRHEGFVFFIHTKFLLVDPLSDDPLICSGSANFSPNSLLYNDENMLLIRGNTRVADIYLTEFDRIFRHFYFRNMVNEAEAKERQGKGSEATAIFLDETSTWTDPYFKSGAFKCRRRELFFADTERSWADEAAQD